MTVVRTRRTRVARSLVALGCATILGSCGGRHTSAPGTPVVTLSGTSEDFASYRVAIDSIILTDTNNNVVTPLFTVESADVAALTDRTELLEVPAMPSGTYKSLSLTLDYSSASIWLNRNGQAVGARAQNPSKLGIGTSTIHVTFDPKKPLVIDAGKSTRLALSVDLAAMNSIDTSTTIPTVTVRPFVVATPAAVDATVMRARGLFVTVPSGTSNFVMNVRPLTDLASALGAVTVSTDAQTYFNINGVTFVGAAGLGVMTNLQENTIIAAFGTLGDLSGITPGFHATSVYVGSSLESPLQEHIIGVVGKRVGNTLTIHGASFLTSVGSSLYANNATVTLASSTLVSQDGVNASGLGLQDISVGQKLDVSGQGSVDVAGNITLDATLGLVRLAPTRLWGTLSSASPSTATLDLLSLGGFAPSGFTFTGTGASGQDANPTAYVIDTGSIDESATAASTLLQVDGFVTPFGAAPPDFTASAITAGTATEQRLIIEWAGTGTASPFTSIGTGGLVVKNDATIGAVHEIRTGPASLDLTTLAAMPLITTVGADQSKLVLAVGSSTRSTGVSVFSNIGDFVSALASTFNGSAKIYRLVAVGQYNAGANSFVASRISVALQQ